MNKNKIKTQNFVCEGSCEKHVGDVVRVSVLGWGEFNYCKEAIKEDKKRGFTVEVIGNE